MDHVGPEPRWSAIRQGCATCADWWHGANICYECVASNARKVAGGCHKLHITGEGAGIHNPTAGTFGRVVHVGGGARGQTIAQYCMWEGYVDP